LRERRLDGAHNDRGARIAFEDRGENRAQFTVSPPWRCVAPWQNHELITVNSK
jgi:hypothetical protein